MIFSGFSFSSKLVLIRVNYENPHLMISLDEAEDDCHKLTISFLRNMSDFGLYFNHCVISRCSVFNI